MQVRHPKSYRILSDGRILQDPMGSDVAYVDLGRHTSLASIAIFRTDEKFVMCPFPFDSVLYIYVNSRRFRLSEQ